MTEKEPGDVLFTLTDEVDFEKILADNVQMCEDEPAGFDPDGLEVPFLDSHWAEEEGQLSFEPEVFIIRVESNHVPVTAQFTTSFQRWHCMYVDPSIYRGYDYIGPYTVTVTLMRAWRDRKRALLAEYKVTEYTM